MNRRDYFILQKLLSAELDDGFEGVELAERNHRIDRGLAGVAAGFEVVPAAVPDLTLTVKAGAGFDELGRRLVSLGDIVVDMSTDTAGASTIPAGGNERWVSVFARFGRIESDPREDGLGNPVNFVQDEGLNANDTAPQEGKLLVIAGAEVAVASPSNAVRPAIPADAILLYECLIISTTTALTVSFIDTNRRKISMGSRGAQYQGGGKERASFMILLNEWKPRWNGAGQTLADAAYLTIRQYITIERKPGVVFTLNARWDGGDGPFSFGRWVADDTAQRATMIQLTEEGVDIARKNDTSSPWDGNYFTGTSWDHIKEIQLFGGGGGAAVSFKEDRGQLRLQAGSAGIPAQIAVVACGGPSGAGPDTLHAGITYPQFQFSTTPSSVTVGGTIGVDANVSSVTVTDVNSNGAIFNVNPTAANTATAARRNISIVL